MKKLLLFAVIVTILSSCNGWEGEAIKKKINIAEYGAKGDGITDDTKAIESAIQAYENAKDMGEDAELIIPTGTWRTTEQVMETVLK